MEVVDFYPKTFHQIPEQDNPAFGDDECMMIVREDTVPVSQRAVALHVRPSPEEAVNRIAVFWHHTHAVKFAATFEEQAGAEGRKGMTAEQEIKAEILRGLTNDEGELWHDGEITADNVDDLWEEARNDENVEDQVQDETNEFRSSGEETGLPYQYSRHYESDAVAKKLSTGKWVGWTYWYGGGKHGEPEAVDWMDEAYFLNVTEEEKMVIVRTFNKAE